MNNTERDPSAVSLSGRGKGDSTERKLDLQEQRVKDLSFLLK